MRECNGECKVLEGVRVVLLFNSPSGRDSIKAAVGDGGCYRGEKGSGMGGVTGERRAY